MISFLSGKKRERFKLQKDSLCHSFCWKKKRIYVTAPSITIQVGKWLQLKRRLTFIAIINVTFGVFFKCSHWFQKRVKTYRCIVQANAVLNNWQTNWNYLKTEQTSILDTLRKYRVEIIQKLFSQEFYLFSRCCDHIYRVQSEALLKPKGLCAVH